MVDEGAGVAAGRESAAVSDCPHNQTTNHVRLVGDEVVWWDECDDCPAIVASSRRNRFVLGRR